MISLNSFVPSNWVLTVHNRDCFVMNKITKEKKQVDFNYRSFQIFQSNHVLKHFVWNNENEKIYIIGEKSFQNNLNDNPIKHINIFDCTDGESVYFFNANNVTLQQDGKSFLYTTSSGDVTRYWFNYTHKDINSKNLERKDIYSFRLQNAKVLRAMLDSDKYKSDLEMQTVSFEKVVYISSVIELAVKNKDIASVKVLLLNEIDQIFNGDQNKHKLPKYTCFSILNAHIHGYEYNAHLENKDMLKEMEEWMHDKKAYEHKHSALIPFVIGTASLNWPALVSTIVAEYLVWVNDDRIAQFSETKSWKIAALVKKRYREINK